MFLLDTNLVSELRRPHRTNPQVAAWADSVQPSDLFLSSITILELETGALRLTRRDHKQGRLMPGAFSPAAGETAGENRQTSAPPKPSARAEPDEDEIPF